MFRHPEDEGYREIKSPGVCRLLSPANESQETQIKRAYRVSGEDSEKRTRLRETFGSLKRAYLEYNLDNKPLPFKITGEIKKRAVAGG